MRATSWTILLFWQHGWFVQCTPAPPGGSVDDDLDSDYTILQCTVMPNTLGDDFFRTRFSRELRPHIPIDRPQQHISNDTASVVAKYIQWRRRFGVHHSSFQNKSSLGVWCSGTLTMRHYNSTSVSFYRYSNIVVFQNMGCFENLNTGGVILCKLRYPSKGLRSHLVSPFRSKEFVVSNAGCLCLDNGGHLLFSHHQTLSFKHGRQYQGLLDSFDRAAV